MSERKFRRGVSKISAAAARETVSAAVRHSTLMVRPNITEPIDYEAFIIKNRTLLQNDSQRDLLLLMDDFAAKRLQRNLRTTRALPKLPSNSTDGSSDKVESSPLSVRECIDSFTRDWNVIDFKHEREYSGSWSELQRLPKIHERLQDQVYEIDVEDEDIEDAINSAILVAKEGYILKGTEAGTDSFISVATKSFKRRWMSLRQGIDGSSVLEFHKDLNKKEPKGAICLDFCQQVLRNSRRGKFAFELRMTDGHKPCILAAENDNELEAWMDVINKALNRSDVANKKRLTLAESTPPSTPKSDTMRSLDLKHNELQKYMHETEYSIAQNRKENRVNVFAVYPDLQHRRGPFSQLRYQSIIKVEPYKPNFGFRFMLTCDKVEFNLKTSIDGQVSQVEPFFTYVSIFHTKLGKLTEEFRFDVNEPSVKLMANIVDGDDSDNDSCPSTNRDYPERWATNPKSAIFSVHSPSPGKWQHFS